MDIRTPIVRSTILLAMAAVLATVHASDAAVDADDRPPNVVLILADDLGRSELGCTGSTRIETPNIDRLRAGGMLFEQAYSGSTVCAPSRCSILTGRHTGRSAMRDNLERGNLSGDPGTPGTRTIDAWTPPTSPEMWWGGQEGMPAGTETIATALRRRGYANYFAGKWGLGGPGTGSLPIDHGFDGSIGFLCQRNAHNFYASYLVEDRTKLRLEGNERGLTGEVYATDPMVERSIAFIEDHADRPFFLMYATPVPHLALQVPEDSLQPYLGRWEETPYPGGKGYLPNETPRATYAAMVSRFDRNVGRIVDALEQAGVLEETIVILTSDNGSTFQLGGYDPVFFEGTGGLRGHKCNLYEGGIRVPLIVSYPGRIEAASTEETVVAGWDLMPTILGLAGATPESPVDGVDLRPVLFGEGGISSDRSLYWEYHASGGSQAARRGPWKSVRRKVHTDPGAPIELYRLDVDPNETIDVSAEHPEIVAEMRSIMESSHTPSEIERWNIPESTSRSDPGADGGT